MNPVMIPSVAVLAKSNAGIGVFLLDVMRLARPGLIAHAARQSLNLLNVGVLNTGI
jgi:hypothetical protein